MTSLPARSSLSSFRLATPKSGNIDCASTSINPHRQALRPVVAEEGLRHVDDTPLPLWGISPQRPVSRASRGYKGGTDLNTTSALESGVLACPVAGQSLTFSSPLTPSTNGALVQLPPSSFEDPYVWEREYIQLRSRFLRPSDAVTIYHDYTSPLNSRATTRHVCVVHPLPSLEKVQEALRRRFTSQKPVCTYDAFERQCSALTGESSLSVMDDTVSVAQHDNGATVRGVHSDQRNDAFLPTARMWCVGGSTYDNEIVVLSGATGQRLMRVVCPKIKVAVTALQHAPFYGFMEARQLHVLPVREPQDVLRLKGSQLVYTDYVWCGFQDGALRLIPASHQHIRACGPSPLYSKSPSVNLVYELPRYQGGAIVSIVRSPGHVELGEDDEASGHAGGETCGGGVSTPLRNRVSEAVRFMTAAADSASASGDASRRHLSLVCAASTDATVIIWDVRKVYEAVAQAQQDQHEMAKTELRGHGDSSVLRHTSLGTSQAGHHAGATAASTASMLCNDVITFDCSSPIPGLQNMVVRSSCTLIQVRPLAKLSGGFAGLTALRWVSSLITAGSPDGVVRNRRDIRSATRIPQIAPCPCTSPTPPRELTQTQTRFDKREAQRAELELTEEEMQGMEMELEHMMPPLATEPLQSLRVNLLVAADCLGTVHVWNLDEELHRYGDGTGSASALGWPAEFGASSRCSIQSRSESRSSVSHVPELSSGLTPTRRSTKRKAATNSVGGVSSRDGGGQYKKTERSLKSRRPIGGLGLAEARESRSRLSDLSANTTSAVVLEASPGYKGQRPPLGRTSGEKRETSSAFHGHWPHGTAGLDESQRRSTGDVAPSLTPPRKSNPLRPRKDVNATSSLSLSKATAASTKKAKKPRSSLQEGSPSMSRSPQQSKPSPSRNSLQRSSVSPGHQGDGHLHAGQPMGAMRPRASAQRGPSVSLGNSSASPVHDLAMPAQVSKCQIRLAEGAAITEMVADLPRQICTTLRRIRNPSSVMASWQHRPTEEEMDARALENEFEELTEEKALFFTFQKLELYVGIDGGAVTTMRCVPEWVLPDYDGRELFKSHVNTADTEQKKDVDSSAAAATSADSVEWMTEMKIPEVVKMDAFQLHLHRRLLDVHVQPITQLFLDAWQGRLWVSRQDGFVSILSTQDKQLVSRIAHPSADSLLPPLPPQEWAKLQTLSIARCSDESRNRTAADVGIMGFGLECHRECKGLPPNHLTKVLPIGTRRQRALIVYLSTSTTEADISFPTCQRRLSLIDESQPVDVSSLQEVRSAAASNVSLAGSSGTDTTSASAATLVCLDGQLDVRTEFRAREPHRWRWLQQLQQCRLDSFAACQAQRRRYYAFCDSISRSVGHVIKELGDYAALSQLRTYFHVWRDHRLLFRHTHVMRRQRMVRLQREQPLARQLGGAYATQLRGAYFVRWVQLIAFRRRFKEDATLKYFAQAAVFCPSDMCSRLRRDRRPLPTAAMMERMHLLSSGRAYFTRWQLWTAEAAAQGRQHGFAEETCQSYTPLMSLRRLASSPLATPLRRICSGKRNGGATVEGGAGAQDMATPYRSIHSSAAEGYAYTSSWTIGRRCMDEGALTPLRMRLDGALLSLPASVEPFMAGMAELLRARVYVFHFSDARSSSTSVLDESWTVLLENAESGADGDSDSERRFSVFRFALLPLLQGLLSTADEVLPNLFDNSVAEEVLSMLVGIVLAMDYVTANAELMPSLSSAAGAASNGCIMDTGYAAEFPAHAASLGEHTHLLSTFDASLAVLRAYAVRAFRTDPEAAEVLRGLARNKRIFAQFLDFAMERAVARRVERL
ncbi:hypothetical protein ABL78_2630 [Leptomonas seymouri]|uniref:Uncharacterized protein n=1 Tax=Leptomonas seymouri TaxID=5684 RepID=A0A0N1ILH4_LEPSE|nr:hypothetical protein ABL78_2630 [Leptomonas seymouri]|eukprot:KPI88268.1 hypothetical protein ABL78_2630 [Leptomonas seymouri]